MMHINSLTFLNCLMLLMSLLTGCGVPPPESSYATLKYRVTPFESENPEVKSAMDSAALVAAVERRLASIPLKANVTTDDLQHLTVELFDTDDVGVEQAKQYLETRGILELRVLVNNRDHQHLIDDAQTATLAADSPAKSTRSESVRRDGKLVAKWVNLPELNVSREPWMTIRETPSGESQVLVAIDPYHVTGEYLTRASATIDSMAQPAVHFSLNDEGAERLSQLTGDNLPDAASGFHCHIGIVLDHEILSAPRLRSRISSEGQITGNFSQHEVDLLVNVLNAGSLPARLTLEDVKLAE